MLWTLLLGLVSGALSQSTEVQQCVSDYQWALNSRNQTPCLVGAYLESACTAAPVDVPVLPPNTHYIGPNFTNANPCTCNTVTYSLISACGGCQNRTYTTWGNWSLNCGVVYTQFPKPIPSAVEVPSWASLNISQTNDNFDPIAAQNSLSQPQPSSTPSGTRSGTSPSTVSTTDPVGTSSTAPVQGQSHAGAIAGGVVGGVVFVAIVTLAVFWFLLRGKPNRRWKRKSATQDRVDLSADEVHISPPMATYSSNTLTTTPMSISQSPLSHIQEFSDLGSPVTSAVHTTFGGRNSMDSIPYNAPQANRGYTGAAEI